jgi:hypothetical protein
MLHFGLHVYTQDTSGGSHGREAKKQNTKHFSKLFKAWHALQHSQKPVLSMKSSMPAPTSMQAGTTLTTIWRKERIAGGVGRSSCGRVCFRRKTRLGASSGRRPLAQGQVRRQRAPGVWLWDENVYANLWYVKYFALNSYKGGKGSNGTPLKRQTTRTEACMPRLLALSLSLAHNAHKVPYNSSTPGYPYADCCRILVPARPTLSLPTIIPP